MIPVTSEHGAPNRERTRRIDALLHKADGENGEDGPCHTQYRKERHLIVAKDDRQFKVIEQMLDP